jgi:hypothetical protein
MINLRLTPFKAIPADEIHCRPAQFKRHNPLVYIALTAALLISMAQAGCSGLTSANATDPATATTMAVSGASGSFGSVGTGASATQTFTVTNTGSNPLSITNVVVTGKGYAITGITLPLSVAAGKSTSVVAKFSPTTAGALTGNMSITANTNPSVTTIPLSGTGTTGGITVNPSSVAFGNVTVTAPNSQTIVLQNNGSSAVTISQATVSGAGFSMSGLSVPATIAAGSSTTFNVAFGPAAAGAVSGSVSLVSNAPGSPTAIPLSGTGVTVTRLLGSSASSLTFGNVAVGSNSAQNITLTNNGNSTVTIGSVSVTGAGYSSSGVMTGQTIGAGQTATLGVTFTPTTTATVSGNVTVTSNATNSPINISLSGTGAQVVAHSASLTWTASTSSVVGYNVYRSTTSGGPYTLITGSPVAGTSFTDTSVQAGVTYFYVVTSVDANGGESVNSNEASSTIPTP